MKRTIVLLLTLGLMSAAPAWADIIYTPITGTGAEGDIGLIDPDNPGTLSTVFVDPAYMSDIFEFDFAIHLSENYHNSDQLIFSFMYDNSSLDVIGAHPLGSWTTNNFEGYEWPNSEAGGIVTVHGLSMGFLSADEYEEFNVSDVVPFLHVTLHVNSEQYSAMNDFGVAALTFISHSYAVTLGPDDFGYFGGTVHEVPEPATVSLLIAGLAALTGGFIRRRR